MSTKLQRQGTKTKRYIETQKKKILEKHPKVSKKKSSKKKA